MFGRFVVLLGGSRTFFRKSQILVRCFWIFRVFFYTFSFFYQNLIFLPSPSGLFFQASLMSSSRSSSSSISSTQHSFLIEPFFGSGGSKKIEKKQKNRKFSADFGMLWGTSGGRFRTVFDDF